MEQKGYAVHIITATTEVENPPFITEKEQFTRDERESSEEREQEKPRE